MDYQFVADRSKRICQIKEGHMNCPLPVARICDDLRQTSGVLDAPTHIGQERILSCNIDEVIRLEVINCPVCQYLVEELPYARGQSNHPKVGRILRLLAQESGGSL